MRVGSNPSPDATVMTRATRNNAASSACDCLRTTSRVAFVCAAIVAVGACGSKDGHYVGSASPRMSIDAGTAGEGEADASDVGVDADWARDADADGSTDADGLRAVRRVEADAGMDPSVELEWNDWLAAPDAGDSGGDGSPDAEPDVGFDAPEPCPDDDGDAICDAYDICPGGDDSVDSDLDGIPDACDACEGESDTADTDGDGVPDACDECPGFDDADDTDGDGVPNGCDLCVGDDGADADGDSVADACDVCPGADDLADADADKIPDLCDVCAGGDDRIDVDGDRVPDDCDPCPFDAPDDSDTDGVCESEDICPLGDDASDVDGDGVPDACDWCPFDAPNDSDGDGVCDSDDRCAAGDDRVDTDGDGVADACDRCPQDAPDDSDGDGVCDADDRCPGGDDRRDSDRDGVPDGCDPCRFDASDDSDGDGVCDGEDRCPGADDTVDGDLDGVPDLCDSCPLDSLDDSDGDGSCDGVDVCPGGDDTVDRDGDAAPDDCDECPDNPDKSAAGLCGCARPEGHCAVFASSIFPDESDTRAVRAGTNLWNAGDYIEGRRRFESSGAPTQASFAVPLENNFLTCGSQAMSVSLDGVQLGLFEISPGDGEIVVAFPVADVAASDEYTIRYETVATVREGCGSAGIQNGIGTVDLTFGADVPIAFSFPSEDDARVGTDLWNAGDFIEGTRTLGFTVEPVAIELALGVEDNVLSCDTQRMVFSVNDAAVGEFEIAPGDVIVRTVFPAAGVRGDTFRFRLETAETVSDGCGSAGIASDLGTVVYTF